MSIKVGLNTVPVSPSHLGDVARRAEELGFESVWIGEHIGLPAPRDSVKGTSDKFTSKSNLYSPFVALSFLAGQTQTLRLGTGICILPFRHPLDTARSVATLDVLSNGRLALGVGIGGFEVEFEILGLDWTSRGRRMDECLAALKVILHDDEPSFEGEFFKFSAVGFEPKPVQKPFPILTAGMTMGAMKRAARYGDGWYAARLSVEKMRESMEIIDGLLQDRGRDPSGFEYTVSVWDPPDRAVLKAYEDIGVHRVLVTPFSYPDIEPEPLRKIEDYARFAGMRR